MKVSFPAMRGVIGKRQYFSTMMALSEIPHLFTITKIAISFLQLPPRIAPR